jgi:hypothetical protein
MTILLTASEPDAFVYANVGILTDAATFQADFARCSFTFLNGDAYINFPPSATNETWFHFDVNSPSGGGGTGYWTFRSASLVNVVRLSFDGSGVIAIQHWNGTSWVIAPGSFPVSGLRTVDIRITNKVAGIIEVYVNNVKVLGVSGDFSGLDTPAQFAYSQRAGSQLYFSQIIAADEPTIGFKLASRHPTGAGFHTAWDGTWDDVDDIVPTMTSFISTGTANARENFTKAVFTAPSSYKVKTVAVAARARRGTTGPDKLVGSLRFGSTDHDSPAKALSLGFQTYQFFWDQNPATLLPWTLADAGSVTVEFGLKAST